MCSELQIHNVVSCNRVAVIKADMAEHHSEIEKECEDIGKKKKFEENVHD